MTDQSLTLLVDRKDLRRIDWLRAPVPDLRAGQALLRIERFALTANNVTYALFGEKMRYWDFYPAPFGYGHLPVWGFAEVVDAGSSGLSRGERIYGLFPLASHCVLQVGDLTRKGLVDQSEWRKPLSASYNWYSRVLGDDSFASSSEAAQAVFRPLFTTSFLIADFLLDSAFFGASQVLVSSASSKTSLGLGYMLKTMANGPAKVIGLTSPANLEFTKATGYFDETVLYAEVSSMERLPTVFVDMAGGAIVRAAVHSQFDELLKHSCAVGGTHWEDPGRSGGLAGPRPKLFFAPGHVEKRRSELGTDWMDERYGAAWTGFLASADDWMEPVEFSGPEAVERLYREVLEGRLPPRCAPMGSVNPAVGAGIVTAAK